MCLQSPIFLFMKREYPDSPLVGVGAIIIENGRVLLVKRGHPPLAGEWSIPGGVLELGETLREAAVREALEETCLSVEPAELLGVFDRVLRDDSGRTLYHYVLVDFLCRRVAGEAHAADDADEVGWFTPVETAALGLAEDTAEVVRMGFEKVKA
jgi:8-oxo-dGTP diphosphatase